METEYLQNHHHETVRSKGPAAGRYDHHHRYFCRKRLQSQANHPDAIWRCPGIDSLCKGSIKGGESPFFIELIGESLKESPEKRMKTC